MLQADFEISNADANTGLTYRAAVDAALQALASLSSGATAPSTTYPNQLWIDTTTSKLKKRTNADDAWVIIGDMDTIYLGLASLAASNEFTASQHLDGDALLLRFRDTGASGVEWGMRSNGGNIEICENTNTEGSPTWTVRFTISPTGANLTWQDLPDGAVVQKVTTMSTTQATYATTIPSDNTIPQVSEGTEILSRTITPKASSHILHIDVKAFAGSANGASWMSAGLFKDGGANAIKANQEYALDIERIVPLLIDHSVAAGGTSEQEWTVNVGRNSANNWHLNSRANKLDIFGGTMVTSIITITEIKA